MLKRDVADKLYSIAVKRYRTENKNVELTNDMLDSIWFSIYGVLQHEGYDKAKEYAENEIFK